MQRGENTDGMSEQPPQIDQNFRPLTWICNLFNLTLNQIQFAACDRSYLKLKSLAANSTVDIFLGCQHWTLSVPPLCSSTAGWCLWKHVKPVVVCSITLPSIGLDPNCAALVLSTEMCISVINPLKLLSQHSTDLPFNTERLAFCWEAF